MPYTFATNIHSGRRLLKFNFALFLFLFSIEFHKYDFLLFSSPRQRRRIAEKQRDKPLQTIQYSLIAFRYLFSN